MKSSVCLLIASSTVLLAFMAHSVSAGGSCLSDANCNQGTCNNGTCVCTNGYVDFGGVSCNYQQREKLTAFLLSFLIGTTGADWFYLAQGNGGWNSIIFLWSHFDQLTTFCFLIKVILRPVSLNCSPASHSYSLALVHAA